jgi:hypothetical protein
MSTEEKLARCIEALKKIITLKYDHEEMYDVAFNVLVEINDEH